jgi:hypothetical protein
MGVSIHLGQYVAKEVGNGKEKNASAKNHVAKERQINFSGFAGTNQVGAEQNSDKSSDDEIVIAVSSICHTKPCIRLLS